MLRYDDPELPEKADVSGHFGRGVDGYQPVLTGSATGRACPWASQWRPRPRSIANEALKRVEIEWEERPFNLDQEEALKPGAPLIESRAVSERQLRRAFGAD